VIDSRTQSILSETLTLAKQLGAIVFRYTGEDIPDTILRFAKEYRVGHIVIGTPGPIPLWKRILGKRSVVERLIEDARGLTVVVLDTHQPSVSQIREQDTHGGQVNTHHGDVETEKAMRLASLLSPDNIALWKDLVTKENVLRELTSRVAEASNTSPDLILDQLLKRENESSTFFNDGVAFPHIRIDGIKDPLLALGIASQGVSDVPSEIPVKLIFLIIAPKEDPNVQIRILGMVSRLARNKNFVEKMIKSDSSEKAWIAILDMERGQF